MSTTAVIEREVDTAALGTAVVALYCRLSPRPDGEYEGVEDQEVWGRRYADQVWPGAPIEVFADRGISAAKDVHRPEYERLRTWIRAGRVRHIWVVEQKRIERKVAGKANWFELAAELDTAGIDELHTNRDGIVRVQDEVAGIKAVLAAAEVRTLTRRVRDTLAEKARRGEPGGRTPWGYTRANREDGVKTLAIVEDQAAHIREAAERILSGWSLRSCAADLEKRGVCLPYGGAMVGDAVRRVLVSPTVAGKRAHGEYIYEGNWTAILDEDTWQALRARLGGARTVAGRASGRTSSSRKVGGRHRKAPKRYLLTGGLIYCGVCGAELLAAVKTRKGGAKVPYYMCRAQYKDVTFTDKGGAKCVAAQVAHVEDEAVRRLFAELAKPEFIAALSADDHEVERARLIEALTAMDDQRSELATLWGNGDLSTTEWKAAREAVDTREQELRSELGNLPASSAPVNIELLHEAWPEMTLEEKRAELRKYIDRVTLLSGRSGARSFDQERVKIQWRYV